MPRKRKFTAKLSQRYDQIRFTYPVNLALNRQQIWKKNIAILPICE